MNRAFLVIGLVIAALIATLGGCGVDKVDSPTAAVYSGIPANVRVSLSSSTVGSGGAATVTATVTEADTEPCPNISVTFSVISAASGTFSPATVVTDASGVATTQFTAADVNATATIRASIAAGTNTLNDSAVITIGNPVRTPTAVSVSLSETALPATGGVATVTAVATDSTGPMSGVTVTFSTSNASAGSLSATTATTNASGIATVTYTANPGNTIVDVRVAAGTLNNSATLQIGTPPPPAPTSITVAVNPLSVGINSQATVNVTLRDANGAPAFNNAVTLTITSGASLASFNTGTLSTINLTTNSSGIASAPIYAGVSSGAVTVQAASSGLSPVSASFFITSDPATVSINVVNSNLINGQTTNITANVKNVMNNAVTDGTTVNFAITSLPPFAGVLSATAASTVNGIASVTFTADSSITGGVIIQASAGTVTPVQTIIIVNAAQAGSLEFVSATPDIINIKGAGVSDSSVKFKVLSAAGVPLANQSVNFQLAIAPVGATLDSGGLTTSSGSTDAHGEVTTILHAGSVAGPVRIVATTTVLGPPIATLASSSGNLSIGGGVPSDRFFSTSVTKFNLDGLNCDNVQSTINALLADRFGNYNILQGTSVSFATDAGAIDTSNVTDALGATISIFRTQDPRPTDVDPLPGEPFYTALVSGVTHTYNPRDGWLTILVATTGEEYFQDNNANGVYDLGEPFTDLPEPFIDSNDNDSREVGELFFDWPAGVSGNTFGLYNGPNGIWDARIPIFREVNLVMTGPPDFGPNTTRIVSGPTETTGNVIIPRGGSADLIVYVSDINMNAPIGGTKVALSSDKAEAKIASVDGTVADSLSYGPAVFIYRITNNNTSNPAVSVNAIISATTDWPGKCGATKGTVYYPGTIILQ